MTEPIDIPMGFRGLLIPLDTDSGDGRVVALADDALLDVRQLPVALRAQELLDNGHEGSGVIGRIERVWIQDRQVWCEGQLNPYDPTAVKWARDMFNGFAGWVSADMDRARQVVTYTDASGAEIPMERLADIGPDVEVNEVRTFVSWRISGATMVSLPAFDAAKLELVPRDQLGDGAGASDLFSPPPIVAAGAEPTEVHTGGMIALMPCAEDANRLAVAGGDHAEELHTTLAYLGDDVSGWTPEQQQACIDAMSQIRPATMDGEVWGHANFNPGDEQCAVYLMSAPGLAEFRQQVVDTLKGNPDVPVDDETDSHDGYVPHMTAGYGMDASSLSETGPVRYDRMRVAIAGRHHDIPLDPTTSALVAAAIVYPIEHFQDPQLTEPTPITVLPDGRVFGHLATWGTCHIGNSKKCVTPPGSPSMYRYFHLGAIDTDAGILPVGHLTMGTGHADIHGNIQAALSHYDNTGSTAAVVRAGQDPIGIWFAGRLVPGMTDEEIAELRRSSLSGDWRGVNHQYELIAALAVNVPGYPIPRPELITSSHHTAMVAAGILYPENPIVQPPAPALSRADIEREVITAGANAQSILRTRAAAFAKVAGVRRETAAAAIQGYRDARADRRVSAAAERVSDVVLENAVAAVNDVVAEDRLAELHARVRAVVDA